MFSFKLPKVREVFSVPNLLDFDKIQPFIYLFVLVFLFGRFLLSIPDDHPFSFTKLSHVLSHCDTCPYR